MFEIVYHRCTPKHALTFDEWKERFVADTGALIQGLTGGIVHINFRNGNEMRCPWAQCTPQEAQDYAVEHGLIMRRPTLEPVRKHLADVVAELPAELLPEAERMLDGLVVAQPAPETKPAAATFIQVATWAEAHALSAEILPRAAGSQDASVEAQTEPNPTKPR